MRRHKGLCQQQTTRGCRVTKMDRCTNEGDDESIGGARGSHIRQAGCWLLRCSSKLTRGRNAPLPALLLTERGGHLVLLEQGDQLNLGRHCSLQTLLYIFLGLADP